MALTIPNLDSLTKQEPRLGEALRVTQNYVNQNTTPAAGNRVPVPPTNPANPHG